MSIESMAIALHHSRSTGTARNVLIGIANHDGDGGAWPSLATLAKYAGGIDRRNVLRALDKLEDLGEISRLGQQGGTPTTPDHLRPTLYRFLLTCPAHCDRSPQHRDARKPLVTVGFTELSTGVAETPPGGGSATGGVAETPPEPSMNHLPRLLKESLDPAARASDDLHAPCTFFRRHRVECDWAASGYCNNCGRPRPDILEAVTA